MIEGHRQISLGREFHDFGATAQKTLSQVATYLAGDGKRTQRKSSENDRSDWVGSYAKEVFKSCWSQGVKYFKRLILTL